MVEVGSWTEGPPTTTHHHRHDLPHDDLPRRRLTKEERQQLTRVDLNCSRTAVDDYEFRSCERLSEVHLSAHVTRLGQGCLYGCRALSTVDWSAAASTLKSMEAWACYGTGLTQFQLPPGVVTLERYVLGACTSLAAVQLHDQLTVVGYCAFVQCTSLRSIQLPSSLHRIGRMAFCKSGLESIELPARVQVDALAFQDCQHLQKVILPPVVRSIEDMVFVNCPRLWEWQFMNHENNDGNLPLQAVERQFIIELCRPKMDDHQSPASTTRSNALDRIGLGWQVGNKQQTSTFEKDSSNTQTLQTTCLFVFVSRNLHRLTSRIQPTRTKMAMTKKMTTNPTHIDQK